MFWDSDEDEGEDEGQITFDGRYMQKTGSTGSPKTTDLDQNLQRARDVSGD